MQTTPALITILKQTSAWMAVEKPAGLPTQAPPGIDSLETRLRLWHSAQASPCGHRYLAMPHRLDVPVSGVVLVARTKKAARLLSEQFQARKIRKVYHAIVAGDASLVEPTWADVVRKLPDQPRVEVVACDRTSEGKDAITTVVQADYSATHDLTRLVLCPRTGRMHQLRVGAASRGFPILGDSLYGGQPARQLRLRAVEIEFHDPANGIRTRVATDPLPWPPGVR